MTGGGATEAVGRRVTGGGGTGAVGRRDDGSRGYNSRPGQTAVGTLFQTDYTPLPQDTGSVAGL